MINSNQHSFCKICALYIKYVSEAMDTGDLVAIIYFDFQKFSQKIV